MSQILDEHKQEYPCQRPCMSWLMSPCGCTTLRKSSQNTYVSSKASPKVSVFLPQVTSQQTPLTLISI
ncbi:hypothetical protein O181_006535 [Austropuccinia psidii MF-1]|uniref:Uncharacterized protein n=1 Tax=Austropuccinia psidii MF-1 TaxID=1389203 RepID=A0A9Q3BKL1_9BASI|nr:hypothetical protein [Austropuccinia psidii MF-1]